MQAAGMVFLPCGGYRGAGSITGANVKVNYWTSSGEGTTKDKAKTKTSNSTTYGGQRYVGRLIRLVREVDPD